MITKEQNNALLSIAEATSKNPKWKEYATYCINREKGLRKLAFKNLDNFITSTQNWTINDKIDFLKVIFLLFEGVAEADYGGFPQPLSEKVIKPTLEKWCEFEKTDNSPFRWYGTYYGSEAHLFKALEMNPSDDVARSTILNWWTDRIYYSIHHLPDGYIGNPQEDLLLIEKIKAQISQLTDNKRKEYYTKELNEDLEIINNYIEWTKSKHLDFEEWGKENKKRVGYNLTTIYYMLAFQMLLILNI